MKAKVVFYVTGENDDGDHFKFDWQQVAVEISPREKTAARFPQAYRKEIFDAAGRNIAEYLANHCDCERL